MVCSEVFNSTFIEFDSKNGHAPLEFSNGYVEKPHRPIFDDLACVGNEKRLSDCNHNGLFNENCGKSESAWVRCE